MHWHSDGLWMSGNEIAPLGIMPVLVHSLQLITQYQDNGPTKLVRFTRAEATLTWRFSG